MKFFNRKKDISYKTVEIAKNEKKNQTLSIRRFTGGDYGINI